MRPAPRPTDPRPRLGRRVLLGGALGAGALALSGCGVRLEDDAPDIPFIPTREPIPAESALIWLLQDCRDLRAADPATEAPYGEQVAVLRSALYRAGIPIETLDDALTPTTTSAGAAPSGSPTTTSATTTTTPPTTTPPTTTTPTEPTTTTPPTEPTATEPSPASTDGPAAALRRVEDLVRCGAGLFPLVVSILAQRWATITVSGADVPAAARVLDSARLWQFPHLAGGFVDVTRAAVYGFEVVAAQSREEARDAALVALRGIRDLLREQTDRAGGKVSSPTIAYPLPFPVNSEESAHLLGQDVMSGLVAGYGGLLTTVTGSAQEDTAKDVIGWLGTAAALGTEWEVPLMAFPGLSSRDDAGARP